MHACAPVLNLCYKDYCEIVPVVCWNTPTVKTIVCVLELPSTNKAGWSVNGCTCMHHTMPHLRAPSAVLVCAV